MKRKKFCRRWILVGRGLGRDHGHDQDREVGPGQDPDQGQDPGQDTLQSTPTPIQENYQTIPGPGTFQKNPATRLKLENPNTSFPLMKKWKTRRQLKSREGIGQDLTKGASLGRNREIETGGIGRIEIETRIENGTEIETGMIVTKTGMTGTVTKKSDTKMTKNGQGMIKKMTNGVIRRKKIVGKTRSGVMRRGLAGIGRKIASIDFFLFSFFVFFSIF